MKFKEILVLIGIFLLSLGIRFYGINWDGFQHLHPDERFLSMVIHDIQVPSNFFEYLNTQVSPLNPYNYKDYSFFVYGTFPIFLIKYLVSIIGLDTYDQAFIFGRSLTIFIDSINIFSLYFLSKLIFKNQKKLVFLPSLFYCFLVLPIQLSHFFTVDPFLNTFLLLSFTLLCYSTHKFNNLILSAVMFGLATSSKISAVFFIPIIILFLLFQKLPKHKLFIKGVLIFFYFLISLLIFRLVQPYSFVGFFNPNPDFINSLNLLNTYSQPDGFYPPSIMWISKIRLLFPLQNIVLWGVGIPLSGLLFYGFFGNLIKNKFNFFKQLWSQKIICFSFTWIIVLFLYQGSRFVYNLRYFLPIYPFICIAAVWFLSKLKSYKLLAVTLFFHFLWCLLFINIYKFPNTRVAATNWIYRYISPGSVLTAEYWDDALPLSINGQSDVFITKWLKLYDQESEEKWQKINQDLKESDYLIMSSNRLWASIPKVSSMYPQTTKFYQDLFEEKTDFYKYKEFNSYPGISLPLLKKCFYLGYTDYPYKNFKNKFFEVSNNCSAPGIYLRDDTAEESFTVYDHPQVLIYKKKSN